MEDQIINKVSQSGLVNLDLEDYYVPGERVVLDIKPWLFEELILKEKDFRQYIKEHNWQQYDSKFVAVTCSADAIVPTWAYMLVGAHLASFARDFVFGDLSKLEEHLFLKSLSAINIAGFRDQRIVIKGCSNKEVSEGVYLEITRLLQPVVKSIMFGEACSTVPVFKRKDV